MSELRKLIDADQDNIKEVERLFANFSSEIHDTIEDTAQMFNTLCRAFGQKAKDDPEQDAINDIGKQLGSKNTKELLSILDSSAEVDSQIGKLVRTGRIALDRIWSRRVRGILLIYTQRCFMWAFTDLCRLRITSAFGHYRVQAEAVGLMVLIRDDPKIAERWLKIKNDSEGIRFFQDFQKK